MRNGNLKKSLFRVGLVIGMLLIGNVMGWAIEIDPHRYIFIPKKKEMDYAYKLTVNNKTGDDKTGYYIWVTHVETEGFRRHVYDHDKLQGIKPGASATADFWKDSVMVGTKNQNEARYYISKTSSRADESKKYKIFRNRINDPRNTPTWQPFGSNGPTFVFSIEYKRDGNSDLAIRNSEYIVTIKKQ